MPDKQLRLPESALHELQKAIMSPQALCFNCAVFSDAALGGARYQK